MARYRLELVNRDRAVLWLSNEAPILDQLEAAGIALPFGCRRGVCLTCTARLAAGRVWHPPNTALGERRRTAGYALPCVARLQSNARLTVGAAIHAELFANPFQVGG